MEQPFRPVRCVVWSVPLLAHSETIPVKVCSRLDGVASHAAAFRAGLPGLEWKSRRLCRPEPRCENQIRTLNRAEDADMDDCYVAAAR
jgi:hypothetical protein